MAYRTKKQVYALRTGDGQAWRLAAEPGMRGWLEQFAAIMQLERRSADISPRVLFMRGNVEDHASCPLFETSRTAAGGLPQHGWRSRKIHLVRLWDHQQTQDILCEAGGDDSPKNRLIQMREFITWIYHRAMDRDGLAFHGALVSRSGVGCILAASGKVGKSTCCGRLPEPWRVLSDDEVLVVRQKSGRYLAHPFPTWSDWLNRGQENTWKVEKAVPLGAVFFLKQARDDGLASLSRGRASAFMYALAEPEVMSPIFHWGHETMAALRRKLFENACELAQTLPSYLLRVSLKGSFWENMDEVLVTAATGVHRNDKQRPI